MSTGKLCTKCNVALEDGIEYCQECGTKVEVEPEIVREEVFCPECGAKTTNELAFCSECGSPLGVEQKDSSATAETSGEKKFALPFKPLYLGIAAAAIVVVIAVVAVFSNVSTGEKHLIYVKDREVQFAYLPDQKPFRITDRLEDAPFYALVASDFMPISEHILMSDNERYLFYPDRVSEDGLTYYWRDLKADNSKSDTATRIDSEIREVPYLTSNGDKFFYLKGDDERLYVFDRQSGERNKLEDNVTSFYVNEAGDYVIYTTHVDEEYTLYEMTLKGTLIQKNKLDSISYVESIHVDDKKVYYLKEGILYLKEFNKDRVRIASDVRQVVSVVNGETVYYLKAEEVTNKLSTFINDDMIANDRNLTEPAEFNYPGRPTEPDKRDYQTEVWYEYYLGLEWNEERGERGYWSSETDYETYTSSPAYDQYWEEYTVWEAEYNRLSQEYNDAYNLYYGKETRDELRAALDSEENAVTYEKYNLYYWTQSGETLVASDLADEGYRFQALASSSQTPVVVYRKYNTSDSATQKLSELISEYGGHYYIDDIIMDMRYSAIETGSISKDVYVASGEKESELLSDNARDWSINKNGTIYFIDDYNTEKSHGVLMSASISNGSVANPVRVDDDVMNISFGNDNGNVYYFKDVKNGSGDLYLNGERIAADLYMSSLYNFKGSNTLLYYIDYSSKNESGSLCILKDGMQTKIADDVSFFMPIGENDIAYLLDYNFSRHRGELMLHSGGESTLLDSDVAALIWKPKMMWGNHSY